VHSYLKDLFYRAAATTEQDWGYGERVHRLWGQLARVAELLKTRLCEEIDRTVQLSGWDDARLHGLQVALPPHGIDTSRGPIVLQHAALDFTTFERCVRPFLDQTGSGNANREFYCITSIFDPIQDALVKARLAGRDITRVLLVGGSSRNPLVERAIRSFFPNATVDRLSDMDTLVAEGAAVHAYFHYMRGHDVLAPIAGDTVGLLAEGGTFVTLVSAGERIPFPTANDWQLYTRFRVPRDLMGRVDLVVCAGSAAHPVHTAHLAFSDPVFAGTPVHLRVRWDANKIFHLEAFLPETPQVRVEASIENPLTLVPMTATERRRAELEQELKRAQYQGTLDSRVGDMLGLSDVLRQLDRDEAALEWVNLAMRRSGRESVDMLWRKAVALYRLGKTDEAHAIYAELARQDKRFCYMAGLTAADPVTMERYMRQAVAAFPRDGVSHYGLGLALRDTGDSQGSRAALDTARGLFEEALGANPNDPTALSFLGAVLDLLGRAHEAEDVRRRHREAVEGGPIVDTTHLPGVTAELVPVGSR
jgi:tetratricopeptide (TPR) repeat protein